MIDKTDDQYIATLYLAYVHAPGWVNMVPYYMVLNSCKTLHLVRLIVYNLNILSVRGK